MSRISLLLLAALGCLTQLPACAPAPIGLVVPAAGREMAITIDDLPTVSVVGSGPAAEERLTARLVEAARTNGIPAVGFVNEGKLFRDGSATADPQRLALLERWLDAGLELGNHTYSHRSLHQTPLADYQADVLRGETETRRLVAAGGGRLRWFRHPFLHAGRDTATHRAMERFLATHGYRIAPVTVDNGDYLFAAAYARAGNRGDTATQRQVAAAYLANMDSVIGYYERQSQALFGREIPQVLLLHANGLNADHLGALAAVIRRRGYRFVPLERALADSAYRTPESFTGAGGISWLHRWALTRGGREAIVPGEPEVPAWVSELARPPAS